MVVIRIVLIVASCIMLLLAVRYLYRKGLAFSRAVRRVYWRGVELVRSKSKVETLVQDLSREPANQTRALAAKRGCREFLIKRNPKGRRFILVASVIAFFSMSLHWAKLFGIGKSGADIEMAFMMILLVYPFIAALFNLEIKKGVGMGLAILNFGIAATVVYTISQKQVLGFIDVSLGLGAWFYLVASGYLIAGISAYSVQETDVMGANISTDNGRESSG